MASILIFYSSNSRHLRKRVVSVPIDQSCALPLKSSLFRSRFLQKSGPLLFIKRARRIRTKTLKASPASRVMAASHSFDVVIVGAGIIGLTIARQFLIGSNLSVAVVDKGVPCSCATGAGQGYIWMAHKTPESDTWDLTMRSHKLWMMLAQSLREQGLDPQEVLGWKKTGSLLVGRTPEESIVLKTKAKQLTDAGLRAEYLSACDLLLKEPELFVGNDTGAIFLPDDCQLDAHRTVTYIVEANKQFALEGRYAEFYHEPVTGFLRSNNNGEVEAVQTSKSILHSKKAIIVAAGCWTGSLMHKLLSELNIMVDLPITPRKGHLLVLENFSSLDLNHGLMEVGYVDHQTAILDHNAAAFGHDRQSQMLSVSMTATKDTRGNLLLGSSREFAGFSTEVDESVILHIWKRAGEFFPKLREVPLKDFIRNRKVRVGLRPYMPDGKPVIGLVPGLSNVLLATGHEGGGLSLALGTGEMVVHMVMGNLQHVDSTPFSLQGRHS